MLDPVVCVGMTLGAPQVDLLALSDLKRLVTAAAGPTSSQRDNGIAWEKVDETARRARADLGQADEPDIRAQQGRRDERCGAERAKVVLTLAQILMQAAGISVEELADDKR